MIGSTHALEIGIIQFSTANNDGSVEVTRPNNVLYLMTAANDLFSSQNSQKILAIIAKLLGEKNVLYFSGIIVRSVRRYRIGQTTKFC